MDLIFCASLLTNHGSRPTVHPSNASCPSWKNLFSCCFIIFTFFVLFVVERSLPLPFRFGTWRFSRPYFFRIPLHDSRFKVHELRFPIHASRSVTRFDSERPPPFVETVRNHRDCLEAVGKRSLGRFPSIDERDGFGISPF